MKKLILVMFSILFILVGCSNPANITKDDLFASGYYDNGNGQYEYKSSTWSVYVTDDGFGPVDRIGVEVYPNVIKTGVVNQDDYDHIQLYYEFLYGDWHADSFVGSTHTVLEPNDAYAYIESVAPEAIAELNKLVETADVSIDILQDGDKTIVEDLVNYSLILYNVFVSESTYTNPTMEASLINGEYFLQVNFDITNEGTESLNLDELDFSLTYEDSSMNSTKITLEPIAPGDTDLSGKVINHGETMSIQMTAVVPQDAMNFYVEVNSQALNIHASNGYIE